MKRILVLALTLIMVFTLGSTAFAVEYLNIATGGTSGTYYPLGGDIAAMLAAEIPDLDINAQATGASAENLRLLNSGDAELAIVQNDVMEYAYKGIESFEGEVIDSFLAIGVLYPELVQLVVDADSGIQSVADLKGRNVSIGATGSGVTFNAVHLLAAAGLTLEDINEQYLSFKESADAFQNKQIEAFFVSAGLPNAAIQEVATSRPVRLVGMDQAFQDALTSAYPFYVPYNVAADTYNGMTEEVTVASISSVLVAKGDLSEDLVYEITKALYEKTDLLNHAKKAEIKLETAVAGVPTPFHPGAIRYYQEKGLMD